MAAISSGFTPTTLIDQKQQGIASMAGRGGVENLARNAG
jgi:hypothetical protein